MTELIVNFRYWIVFYWKWLLLCYYLLQPKISHHFWDFCDTIIYSIVPSSKWAFLLVCLSISLFFWLFLCWFVYKYGVPWSDHSRICSENSLNDWRLTKHERIADFIPFWTRPNYATFQNSAAINISINSLK